MKKVLVLMVIGLLSLQAATAVVYILENYRGLTTNTSSNTMTDAIWTNDSTTFYPNDNFNMSTMIIRQKVIIDNTFYNYNNVNLVLKGINGQTSNLINFTDYNGNTLSYIKADGSYAKGAYTWIGQDSSTYSNVFKASTAARIPLSIYGATGQTANLQEWKNSTGSTYTYIDKDGNIVLSDGGTSALRSFTMYRGGVPIGGWNTGNARVQFQDNIGNGISFQNSTGGANIFITNTGYVGIGTNNPSVKLHIVGSSAALNSIYSLGGLGLLNNSGTLVGGFTSNAAGTYFSVGDYYGGGASAGLELYAGDDRRVRIYNSGEVAVGGLTSTGTLNVDALSASKKGLIVKGAASQTANLQEWENSAGTALTTIDSVGNITIGGLAGSGNAYACLDSNGKLYRSASACV